MDDEFSCTQVLSPLQELEISFPAERKPVAVLEVDGVRHEVFPGSNIVGRNPDKCSIVIDNKSVSGEHAVIEVDAGERDLVHMLSDMGSRNKTRLGQLILKPHVRYHLKDGDVLQIADVKGTYHVIQVQSDSILNAGDTFNSSEEFICDSPARPVKHLENTKGRPSMFGNSGIESSLIGCIKVENHEESDSPKKTTKRVSFHIPPENSLNGKDESNCNILNEEACRKKNEIEALPSEDEGESIYDADTVAEVSDEDLYEMETQIEDSSLNKSTCDTSTKESDENQQSFCILDTQEDLNGSKNPGNSVIIPGTPTLSESSLRLVYETDQSINESVEDNFRHSTAETRANEIVTPRRDHNQKMEGAKEEETDNIYSATTQLVKPVNDSEDSNTDEEGLFVATKDSSRGIKKGEEIISADIYDAKTQRIEMDDFKPDSKQSHETTPSAKEGKEEENENIYSATTQLIDHVKHSEDSNTDEEGVFVSLKDSSPVRRKGEEDNSADIYDAKTQRIEINDSEPDSKQSHERIPHSESKEVKEGENENIYSATTQLIDHVKHSEDSNTDEEGVFVSVKDSSPVRRKGEEDNSADIYDAKTQRIEINGSEPDNHQSHERIPCAKEEENENIYSATTQFIDPVKNVADSDTDEEGIFVSAEDSSAVSKRGEETVSADIYDAKTQRIEINDSEPDNHQSHEKIPCAKEVKEEENENIYSATTQCIDPVKNVVDSDCDEEGIFVSAEDSSAVIKRGEETISADIYDAKTQRIEMDDFETNRKQSHERIPRSKSKIVKEEENDNIYSATTQFIDPVKDSEDSVTDEENVFSYVNTKACTNGEGEGNNIEDIHNAKTQCLEPAELPSDLSLTVNIKGETDSEKQTAVKGISDTNLPTNNCLGTSPGSQSLLIDEDSSSSGTLLKNEPHEPFTPDNIEDDSTDSETLLKDYVPPSPLVVEDSSNDLKEGGSSSATPDLLEPKESDGRDSTTPDFLDADKRLNSSPTPMSVAAASSNTEGLLSSKPEYHNTSTAHDSSKSKGLLFIQNPDDEGRESSVTPDLVSDLGIVNEDCGSMKEISLPTNINSSPSDQEVLHQQPCKRVKVDDDIFDAPTQIICHEREKVDDDMFDAPTQIICREREKVDDGIFDAPTQIMCSDSMQIGKEDFFDAPTQRIKSPKLDAVPFVPPKNSAFDSSSKQPESNLAQSSTHNESENLKVPSSPPKASGTEQEEKWNKDSSVLPSCSSKCPSDENEEGIFDAPTQKIHVTTPTAAKAQSAASPEVLCVLQEDENFCVAPTKKVDVKAYEVDIAAGTPCKTFQHARTRETKVTYVPSNENEEEDLFDAPTQKINVEKLSVSKTESVVFKKSPRHSSPADGECKSLTSPSSSIKASRLTLKKNQNKGSSNSSPSISRVSLSVDEENDLFDAPTQKIHVGKSPSDVLVNSAQDCSQQSAAQAECSKSQHYSLQREPSMKAPVSPPPKLSKRTLKRKSASNLPSSCSKLPRNKSANEDTFETSTHSLSSSRCKTDFNIIVGSKQTTSSPKSVGKVSPISTGADQQLTHCKFKPDDELTIEDTSSETSKCDSMIIDEPSSLSSVCPEKSPSPVGDGSTSFASPHETSPVIQKSARRTLSLSKSNSFSSEKNEKKKEKEVNALVKDEKKNDLVNKVASENLQNHEEECQLSISVSSVSIKKGVRNISRKILNKNEISCPGSSRDRQDSKEIVQPGLIDTETGDSMPSACQKQRKSNRPMSSKDKLCEDPVQPCSNLKVPRMQLRRRMEVSQEQKESSESIAASTEEEVVCLDSSVTSTSAPSRRVSRQRKANIADTTQAKEQNTMEMPETVPSSSAARASTRIGRGKAQKRSENEEQSCTGSDIPPKKKSCSQRREEGKNHQHGNDKLKVLVNPNKTELVNVAVSSQENSLTVTKKPETNYSQSKRTIEENSEESKKGRTSRLRKRNQTSEDAGNDATDASHPNIKSSEVRGSIRKVTIIEEDEICKNENSEDEIRGKRSHKMNTKVIRNKNEKEQVEVLRISKIDASKDVEDDLPMMQRSTRSLNKGSQKQDGEVVTSTPVKVKRMIRSTRRLSSDFLPLNEDQRVEKLGTPQKEIPGTSIVDSQESDSSEGGGRKSSRVRKQTWKVREGEDGLRSIFSRTTIPESDTSGTTLEITGKEHSYDNLEDSSVGKEGVLLRKRQRRGSVHLDKTILPVQKPLKHGRAKVAQPNEVLAKTEEETDLETSMASSTLTRFGSAAESFSSDCGGETKRRRRGDTAINSSSPRASPRKSIGVSKQSTHHVLFTSYNCPRHEDIVKQLGGFLVDSSDEANVLVTDKLRRTVKLLSMMGRGQPIVCPRWLIQSQKAGRLLDPWDYLLNDMEAETKFNFTLKDSLKKAADTPLLQSYSIFITKNVTPPLQEMKVIVTSCGGKLLARAPSVWPQNSVVVSCEEDHVQCKKFKGKVDIVSSEWLLSGVLKQELDMSAYKLE